MQGDMHAAPEPAEAENRGSLRRRVLKAAQIVYNNGHSVLDCTIHDLSESGARIKLESPTELPDSFRLHFSDGRRIPVEVIWRTSAMLGVQFVAARHPRPQSVSAGTKSSLIDRLNEIERQLAQLRSELMVHLRE